MISPWHPSQTNDRRNGYELWITCSDCGDVVVPAEVCELHATVTATEHRVAFPCSSCGRRESIVVTEQDVADLLDAGFVIHGSSVAAELLEARPCAEPFSWDDLLSFHEKLQAWDGRVDAM
jgi:hypothetical protein